MDNETVEWISTGPSEVDVLRFRDAISAGDLELAVRAYSGDRFRRVTTIGCWMSVRDFRPKL